MKLFAAGLITCLSLFGASENANRRAPGFSLMDSKFAQHDPQDYRGKVVLVEFMQTTCGVCLQLTEHLVQVKQKFGDKIAILSITTAPDSFQTGDQYAKDHHLSWPILFDMGQVMMSYLKMTPTNLTVHFPHLFVIDGQGMIRADFDNDEPVDRISAEIEKIAK
jgi:peroxiredoxin